MGVLVVLLAADEPVIYYVQCSHVWGALCFSGVKLAQNKTTRKPFIQKRYYSAGANFFVRSNFLYTSVVCAGREKELKT